jgi:hypothetical protein
MEVIDMELLNARPPKEKEYEIRLTESEMYFIMLGVGKLNTTDIEHSNISSLCYNVGIIPNLPNNGIVKLWREFLYTLGHLKENPNG